ncbi:hypothetical protein EAF00_005592 [Botryotinia globosa]|nr:hypothetical protein EAF00_005592 [Botryotinia globosa]
MPSLINLLTTNHSFQHSLVAKFHSLWGITSIFDIKFKRSIKDVTIHKFIGSGAPGKPRKNENEYSSNAHSVYERERLQNLPPDVRTAYKARENARVKTLYHIKKLKKTALYQSAGEEDRKRMEEEKRSEIKNSMKIEKPNSGANRIILRGASLFTHSIEIGSDTDSQSEMSEEENDDDLFDFDAITDNENDEWEEEIDEWGDEKEEEDDDDDEFNDMEMNVDDFDEGVVRQLEGEMGVMISDEWKVRFDNGIWGEPREAIAWIHNLPRWKNYWGKAYDRFEATMRNLIPSAPSALGCDWVVHQGARYPKKLPHQLFDCSQRAIWRNLSVWAPEKLNQLMDRPSSEPLSLPGPSGWWVFLWRQHKYSAKRHGFWQPKQAMMQKSKNAWNLLFFAEEKKESEEYVDLLYVFSKHDFRKPNNCFYL